MKNLIKLNFQVIIAALIIVSCNKSDDNVNTGNVQLTNYFHSECKGWDQKSTDNDESLILKAIGSN